MDPEGSPSSSALFKVLCYMCPQVLPRSGNRLAVLAAAFLPPPQHPPRRRLRLRDLPGRASRGRAACPRGPRAPEPGGEKALALLQTCRTWPALPPRRVSAGHRAGPRCAAQGRGVAARWCSAAPSFLSRFSCRWEKYNCKVAEPSNFSVCLLPLDRSSSFFFFLMNRTLSHTTFCVCSCYPLLVI